MTSVFTTVGEIYMVDVIDAALTTNYIGWGASSTAAAKGDTNLVSASTEARVAGTRTQPSASILQWVGTITANGTKTITEAGLFDVVGSGSPPTGGFLLIREVFTGVPVEINDTIEFTFTLELT